VTTACVTADANAGWLSQVQMLGGNCAWNTGTAVTIGASTSNFDIKGVNFFSLSSPSNIVMQIAAGASGGQISQNHVNGSVAASYLQNASSSVEIDDRNGMALSSLPTATNGSSFAVTGVTAGSSPCTSGSSSSVAFYVNGTKKCL